MGFWFVIVRGHKGLGVREVIETGNETRKPDYWRKRW